MDQSKLEEAVEAAILRWNGEPVSHNAAAFFFSEGAQLGIELTQQIYRDSFKVEVSE